VKVHALIATGIHVGYGGHALKQDCTKVVNFQTFRYIDSLDVAKTALRSTYNLEVILHGDAE
jgi:hypothetical protein